MSHARVRGQHDGADDGVELLERALSYTRGVLLHVEPAHLHRRTPCAHWSLDQLLCHMDDALDAFTEAAGGTVALEPAVGLEARVTSLQVKACGLMGAWSGPVAPDSVTIGHLPVRSDLLVRAAALEITVHGWDVAQSTGIATPVPDALARALRPVAQALVDDDDRDARFAAPLHVGQRASDGTRLLAFLGRHPDPELTGPPPRVSTIRRTQHRSAS